tara:strand:- start:974 stop:1147 length:174 start_codon:yes stop_codon:yes gene_type:complete
MKKSQRNGLARVFQNIELLIVPQRKIYSEARAKMSIKSKLIYAQVSAGMDILNKDIK